MKILFTISQLGGGGAERVVSVLANGFASIGWNVEILMIYDRPIAYELDKRIKLTNLHCKRGRILGSIQQIFAIRKYYKKTDVDVIVSFLVVVNMVSILAHLGCKIPLIISERNDPNRNPRSNIVRIMRDKIYRFAEGNVFQTPDAKRYFEDKKVKNGIVIPNPLKECLPEPFLGERKKTFVTAVRLEKQKNIPLLIKAFACVHELHPEYSLRIFGDGPDKDELIRLCTEHDINDSVKFEGFSKNWHSLILDASCFVLPSDYEGLSNSLIEALALGIPVISTDHPIGGAKMFVENHKNGILIPVGDENALVDAMMFIIDNPDSAWQYAKNAQSIRAKLAVDTIVQKWIEYVQTIKAAF